MADTSTVDPVDTTPDDTPRWVDTAKTLVRPIGCYVVYALTAYALYEVFGIARNGKSIDLGLATTVIGFLGGMWAHVYQYTWARSAEKKANAD